MLQIGNEKTYVLWSYPRSGTNYFERAWKQKTGKNITVFRTPGYADVLSKQDNLEIISTIREPFASLVSRTMIYYHEPAHRPIEETIWYSIESYKKIYTSITNVSDHIIDMSCFDNLDLIIDKITGKENKKINKEQIDRSLDNIGQYSKTFIGHEDYEKFSEWVTKYNISYCKELYSKAYDLSKYKTVDMI